MSDEQSYTVHLVDGDRSYAIPTRGGDIVVNYDDRSVWLPVDLEALRGMLGAGHPSEAEGEQGGYQDDVSDDHPIVAWWLADAREVAEATVPKAVEYGSVELIEAGRILARLMGRDEVSDQEAAEVQIFQYMLGKMGRWTAALGRGERVSDDSILDLMVYATMVRKIRQTGEWA